MKFPGARPSPALIPAASDSSGSGIQQGRVGQHPYGVSNL